MNTIQALNERYTTKAYDATKKIPDETFNELKAFFRLSPSSLNLQPWHFIVADDDAGKIRVAKGCPEGYELNKDKILHASHVVVLCSKLTIDESHIQKIADSEEQAGRFRNADSKKARQEHIQKYVNKHKQIKKDEPIWHAKQVYLNMGMVMLGASALGIDCTPMEGIDLDELNTEFGLIQQGMQALAVLAFGCRSEEDYNADLPKARLTDSEIFSKA